MARLKLMFALDVIYRMNLKLMMGGTSFLWIF